ncbi:galactose mutarotase-like domain-containing protein [Stachybotrys elegans]|uniref:Galactose mutarotase-like domain-containing protein n=1 Tax=Stachybotrys elegans TaxID=80388 RepID=A0A8K0T156_9HYPO|nr:galactose mutarotase-like domain-containing protein [Stachybotrys elegans]
MTDAPFAFLPLGAIIQDFKVNGLNIVQGFATQDQYVKYNGPYFGETIGRIANRISNAKLNDIDGKEHPLVANERTNTLHGGNVGWGKRIWNGPKPVGTKTVPGVDGLDGGESVEFTLVSEHGDEGFPGTVEAKITYTTGTQEVNGKQAVVLSMEYEANLVGGANETVINMTNHSYFNLSGEPSVEGAKITLSTNDHLPMDSNGLPTGGPAPFSFDTRQPFSLGANEPFVDHAFVVNTDPASVPIDTRSQPLNLNLAAHHPKSGIHLEVHSTEPAFQVYNGCGIDVPAVDGLPARGPYSGFCCEPGRYTNAANVPEWKSMVLLKKGETYGARIVYKAWSD